jgi:hypothetical protein
MLFLCLLFMSGGHEWFVGGKTDPRPQWDYVRAAWVLRWLCCNPNAALP